MADTLSATQLRKGMIIKLDKDLFRIHDRQHVTPGNLRGFVRLKMRNLRNGTIDGNTLVTAGKENKIRVWSLEP